MAWHLSINHLSTFTISRYYQFMHLLKTIASSLNVLISKHPKGKDNPSQSCNRKAWKLFLNSQSVKLCEKINWLDIFHRLVLLTVNQLLYVVLLWFVYCRLVSRALEIDQLRADKLAAEQSLAEQQRRASEDEGRNADAVAKLKNSFQLAENAVVERDQV